MSSPLYLPAPGDLGLPAKFGSWRLGQAEAIHSILGDETGARYFGLLLPTGAGKSIIYMALTAILQSRAVILTATKGLQDQLLADFAGMGLVDIRGRNNYTCARYNGTCADGKRLHCSHPACPAAAAFDRARAARVVVTNYTYWLLANRAYQRARPRAQTVETVLGSRDLLVLDEAHDAPQEIMSAAQLAIYPAAIADAQLPHGSTPRAREVALWRDWASRYMGKVEAQRNRVRDILRDDARRAPLLREFSRLDELTETMSTLASIDPSEWACETGPHGAVIFEPLGAGSHAQDLWCGVPQVLLTSATLLERSLTMLNLAREDCLYHEFPTSFPPAFGPVYHFPGKGSPRIDHRAKDSAREAWLALIDRIVAARADRKGIIHAVSYERARWIAAHSHALQGRLILHGPGQPLDTPAAVRRYKEASEPVVLISPSLVTGYDFPYRECEFQVIAKVPFLMRKGQAIQQARAQYDPGYDAYLTAQSLVQAAGRGRRAPDDRCEVFIPDSHFSWFYAQHMLMFPRWFRVLVKALPYRGPGTTLPPPPPRAPGGRPASSPAPASGN